MNTGWFNILSKDDGVPLVTFSLKDRSRYNEFMISAMLRHHGWVVPAYPMPPGAEHVTVLRVVIRADFSHTMAERLVMDITNVLHQLDMLSHQYINEKDEHKTTMIEHNTKNSVGVDLSFLDVQREDIVAQEAHKRQPILAA